jgi:glycosyltransferase involved in cell wall biosynthesis
MFMVRISACINNNNAGRFLGEAIDSVFAQTYPPLEVIVVDDGSTDGSADFVAKTYGDRVRLIRSENLGRLSAFRLGVRAASGDFIAFLDADDRWKCDHLAEVAERLGADPAIDFTISEKLFFGDSVPKRVPEPLHNRVFECNTLGGLSGEGLAAETSCLTARKSCLAFLYRLAPEMVARFKLGADGAISFGAGIQGARKIWISSPTVEYRAHGQNYFIGRVETDEEAATRREDRRELITWLYEMYFPGMNAAAIVRREIGRNTVVKNRNKRRLYKAVWRCPATLGEKLAATFAILAKR